MRYHVFAVDYNGTLADSGSVSEAAVKALERLVASGRKLVLLTGLTLPELQAQFPDLSLFHWIVAENGALLYQPSTKKEILIGAPPPQALVEGLIDRHVAGCSVGKCIVSTRTPSESLVLEVIRELGLDMQIVFNKGTVMVLPAGINKGVGLEQALKEMKLSRHNTVGVGDAENDHAFLRECEFSACTANAVPALHASVNLSLKGEQGRGVIELIDLILSDDLRNNDDCISHAKLSIARREDEVICLPTYGGPTVVCGGSGSGKSTLSYRIVDALIEYKYQFCLIDPEGDYETLEGAVVLGGPTSVPILGEAIHVLRQPEANLVICLTGVAIPDRPAYFLELVSEIEQLRSKWGRPHWLILDEAHHLMPADWIPPLELLPENWMNVVLITLEPRLLPITVAKKVKFMAIVGKEADTIVHNFANDLDLNLPTLPTANIEAGQLWICDLRKSPATLEQYVAIKSDNEHQRHQRKYAEGQLSEDRSFYFRGPDKALNLRAQNLILFCQLAEGVDDATWLYHLERDDYTRWFRECIKDEALAVEASQVAAERELTAQESKNRLLAAITREYTKPADILPVPNAS